MITDLRVGEDRLRILLDWVVVFPVDRLDRFGNQVRDAQLNLGPGKDILNAGKHISL